jgi:hypothetical protein
MIAVAPEGSTASDAQPPSPAVPATAQLTVDTPVVAAPPPRREATPPRSAPRAPGGSNIPEPELLWKARSALEQANLQAAVAARAQDMPEIARRCASR